VVIPGAIALSLAFGAAEACAAQTAPASPLIQQIPNASHPVQDLGDLPPPPDADDTNPATASASTVSNAQSVPELPVWAMLLVFFGGIALARLKRRRKDRLSPGLE
jgi:hypothetical protein